MPMQQPSGALPIYLQVSEMLIRDIAAGRLADGSRLPPERDMAKSLDISVGTLRKSLAELEKAGLLERRQGSGNYVQHKVGPEGIYAFFRLELSGGGGLPTANVIDVARMTKPADLPQFGTSIDAHRIRRIRFLSGQPAAIEEIWLDASYAETISPSDLSESLYLFYREALDLWITGYDDYLSAATCPDWAPTEFGILPGNPCGFAERLSWARTDEIAEVSRTWIDSNVARYVARMR